MYSHTEYSKFLSSLKVGDVVGVSYFSYGSNENLGIAHVIKISKTRRITLSNNAVYNSDGNERTSDFKSSHIVQYDDDFKARLNESNIFKEKRNKIADIIACNYSKLDIETIRKIHELIQKGNVLLYGIP